MTKVTRAALIAALTMGAGGLMVTAPAMAKKDDKKDAAATGQAAPLKLTPEFQKGAIDAQNKLKANDLAGADAALTQADAAAKTDDDNYISAQLHLGIEQAKLRAASGNDPNKFAAGQAALLPAINKLIDNPRTPQADKAKFLEARGGMYYDGKKYAEAAADYSRARDAGSANPDIGLLVMKAKAEGGDTDGAAAELQKLIDARGASGQPVPDTWYRYILSKYLKQKAGPQSVVWSQKLVKAYPTPVNWRAAIAVYAGSVAPSVKLDARQQLDLLRLLRAAGALADENDYNDYAQKTDDLGLYGETLSVIDEGTKNGKLPAGNQLAKMLKGSSTTGASLEKPLTAQEAAARASKTGDLAAQVGDSYLGRADYAKAAEFYRLALSKPFEKSAGTATKRHFLDNDEVTMHLGIALARGGDKAGAKTAFDSITSSPRKEIAGFWETWLDTPAPAAS
ncbi:hypothetical protein ACLB0R_09825 [Sphingomonas sp. GlSt437]|uniref:hypothetical protein n=1 Tax=Sphingomonas sp. GlSt437 TaxID=3389970 RepID=UPI003A85CA49